MNHLKDSNDKVASSHKCAQWLNANFHLNVSGKQVYSKYHNVMHSLRKNEPTKPQSNSGTTIQINLELIDKVSFTETHLVVSYKK